jgi:hypothetical protein
MLIASEGGKPLKDAQVEATRAAVTLGEVHMARSTAHGHREPHAPTHPKSADVCSARRWRRHAHHRAPPRERYPARTPENNLARLFAVGGGLAVQPVYQEILGTIRTSTHPTQPTDPKCLGRSNFTQYFASSVRVHFPGPWFRITTRQPEPDFSRVSTEEDRDRG